jgi:hypothetical protein
MSLALSILVLALPCAQNPDTAVDVPLAFWTNIDWPNGLDMGIGRGVSWGDYDADGWPDILTFYSGRLLRNLQGQSWQFTADVLGYIHNAGPRYGCSFGDYDADGLPDIATEPRGPACFHLLHNLGGALFVDVAPRPTVVDVQVCGPVANCEGNCWADVDGDLDLDLFLPLYPQWAFNGIGNRFYRNLGPSGSGGAYQLQEFTTLGGFENPPPDSARPEGAEFCDVDSDGDLDLYSNGTLYQNRSTAGVPAMLHMSEHGSGIGFHDVLDEGAALADYDMDGDWDLFVAYTSANPGVVIWENEGDGTFFRVEPGVVQSPTTGLGLGLSIADWDGDGDDDFTTKNVFRRNQLVETGVRTFTVATHNIPESELSAATPAWADWDRDGDLDCALGNHGAPGRFYENVLYVPSTPASERRHLRIRPVRDADGIDRGLETEYGASVRVDVLGDTSGLVRRKHTASSGGYTNQNEYDLTFGLPPDPAPGDDAADLHLEIQVDFPNLPSEGYWRVDRHVNPVLGDVDLASLASREILVWRSGKVRIDGVDHAPCESSPPVLELAGGGLAEADPETGLLDPVPASADEWVGLDFDTLGATKRVRVREIVLDGRLAPPVACGALSGNLALWDVSVPGAPVLVPDGVLARTTNPRNHRSFLPVDLLLEKDRRYRLVARVDFMRASRFTAPWVSTDLAVHGGLAFQDGADCSGAEVEAAIADPTRLWLTVRFAPEEGVEHFCDSLANSTGRAARLDAPGSTSVSWNQFYLRAWDLPPLEPTLGLYGQLETQRAFGDGYRCLGGHVFRLVPGVTSGADGTLVQYVDFPSLSGAGTIVAGSTWSFQLLYRDRASPGAGFNATDGIRVTFCR